MGCIHIRRRLAPGWALSLIMAGLLVAGAPAARSQEGDVDHHHHPVPAPATGQEVEAAGELSIPDVRLLDQDGEAVRFYSDLVADKVVAMNFVFTTCSTVCPPMGAIFGRLQRDLGERVGRDVHLVSVSVDPVTDTPQRLEAWSNRFGAGPGWTLVTGDKVEVDRLLKALGVFTPDFADHSPTVLVGNDAAGFWQRAYGLAPAAKLAELIAQADSAGNEEETSP